jgi:hypothetical protein
MRKRAPDILFWFVLALSAAVLGGLLLLVGGILPVEDPSDRSAGLTETASTPAPAPAPASRTTARAETQKRTAAPPATTPTVTTTAKPPPATLVVVTASRGDSWFSARLGSESGRVLDERVLAQGESVSLKGERIWLTVGAAGNVDLTVNGKPREIQPGTVELVLQRPASGAS